MDSSPTSDEEVVGEMALRFRAQLKSGDITDLIDKIDLIIENYETISEIVI
jgi:hypothetical protein